jgi:hypothetical protein
MSLSGSKICVSSLNCMHAFHNKTGIANVCAPKKSLIHNIFKSDQVSSSMGLRQVS